MSDQSKKITRYEKLRQERRFAEERERLRLTITALNSDLDQLLDFIEVEKEVGLTRGDSGDMMRAYDLLDRRLDRLLIFCVVVALLTFTSIVYFIGNLFGDWI